MGYKSMLDARHTYIKKLENEKHFWKLKYCTITNEEIILLLPHFDYYHKS